MVMVLQLFKRVLYKSLDCHELAMNSHKALESHSPVAASCWRCVPKRLVLDTWQRMTH